MFLPAPRTPSSASAFLWFVRVTFSHPAITAVTRVQIPSGTPNLINELPGFPQKLAVQQTIQLGAGAETAGSKRAPADA